MSLSALALAAALQGAPGPSGSAGPADVFEHRVQRVAPRIFLIYRPDAERVPVEGNVEVIVQRGGLVVVDAGGSTASGEDVVRNIRRISPLPVRYLIYTHWHGDHNLGASAIRKAFPKVTVIATEATRRDLASDAEHLDQLPDYNRKAVDHYREVLTRPGLDPDLASRLTQTVRDADEAYHAQRASVTVLPTKTFADRLELPDAEAPVSVRFLGKANTDGDAVVWLPRQRVLIAGDIVVAPVPYGSESYSIPWSAALATMDAMDFVHLIPGHGDVQSGHVYLRRVAQLLVDLRTLIVPLARQGVTLAEVQSNPALLEISNRFAGPGAWRRSEMRAYFVMPMAANILAEAKGEPIAQGAPLL